LAPVVALVALAVAAFLLAHRLALVLLLLELVAAGGG
jgi:hypothetical protein